MIFSDCVTVKTSLQAVRGGPAPPPEICLYPLLGDNRVVSPPPVPVQNRCAVLPGGFPALQLPVDRRRGNAQPFGNVRRAFVRLIQRGNLLPVRKSYVFVVPRHHALRCGVIYRNCKRLLRTCHGGSQRYASPVSALHHQFVASARVVKYAREHYPHDLL